MGVFSVVIPAIIIGGAGWGALGRSIELTQGHRWSIVGGILLVIITSIGVGLVIGIFGGIVGMPVIADAISGAFGFALSAIYATVVYARLTEDVADVF
jgi:hypothetical protein